MKPTSFMATGFLVLVAISGCTAGEGDAGKTSCDGRTRDGLTLSDAAHSVAAIATTKGCIVVELYDDKTPITVTNFLTYVEEGFFTELLFHRIIKDFMVQTGGMKRDGQFKDATHAPIQNEAASSGLKNVKWTLAMARTNDPDSATNQFFINTDDNSFLDASGSSPGYAVFGSVVSDLSVVDAIQNTPVEPYAAGKHCQSDSQPSCPTQEIVLWSIQEI